MTHDILPIFSIFIFFYMPCFVGSLQFPGVFFHTRAVKCFLEMLFTALSVMFRCTVVQVAMDGNDVDGLGIMQAHMETASQAHLIESKWCQNLDSRCVLLPGRH